MSRIRQAGRAGMLHLGVSVILALLAAALVFGLWYPFPYSTITGGSELFLLLVAVDVVCGPLLTLVVFNPVKPRAELVRDITVIAVLQCAALLFGLSSVFEARPVYLAYEGDRFRVVTAAEIDYQEIDKAPEELRTLSVAGPRLLGVRLLDGSDPEYMQSIRLAMRGLHPSLRPDRWVEYGAQIDDLLREAHPVTLLRDVLTTREWENLEEMFSGQGLRSEEVGYLPLVSRWTDTWIVLVSLEDGLPVGYAPIDGWGEK
ncbi:TfpX/TfpZ family type IV pilin accessory protein [Alcanivorax sediminis]|uniref:Pilus assembly protein n=1 Tax=Alcanivorax sediminis TaxID=2663008 RepID=A0A6N7LVE0_9GAMM|nr:TfpX/TfpZ family type IV pilin accessory protein [Alcanivorax sediminis]MQX54468.1 pilus assembly protein [Alcanivorax sediminis]